MICLGTVMPALRQPRRPCTWVMVVEPSSNPLPSLALLTYPQPPTLVWARPEKITARLSTSTIRLRWSGPSSSPST